MSSPSAWPTLRSLALAAPGLSFLTGCLGAAPSHVWSPDVAVQNVSVPMGERADPAHQPAARAPSPNPHPTRAADPAPPSSDPIHVAYRTAGDPTAPRVIYVHGTPGDSSAWAHYLEDPIPGLEAIAIDRPGFGDSGPASGDAVTSFAAQAAAIEPLLVERDGRWPILVGHSLGGPIICQVAAEHPDEVGGLVILAGSVDPSLETMRWFNAAGALLSPILAREWRNANKEVLAARREETALASLLPRIACPVIVLHGEKDELVPVANTVFIKSALTGSASVEIEIFPRENHFIPWTREPEVREAIERLRDRPAD